MDGFQVFRGSADFSFLNPAFAEHERPSTLPNTDRHANVDMCVICFYWAWESDIMGDRIIGGGGAAGHVVLIHLVGVGVGWSGAGQGFVLIHLLEVGAGQGMLLCSVPRREAVLSTARCLRSAH